MRGRFGSKAWGRFVRIAALGAGVLALAGCATGYAFVQPDAAGSGGYYTSDGSYPGYYGDSGPYFPGPYDSGYYDFGGFGYDTVYGPSFTFGLGFGNVCGWTCAGLYGGWPWYAGGFGYPYPWGWYRTGRNRHHHHRDGHDPVASGPAPHSWPGPGRPPIYPRARRGSPPAVAMPARPMEDFAHRRPLDSASFAPHDFVRVPIQRPGTEPHPTGMPAPAYVPSLPEAPVFGRGQIESRAVPMAAPRAFSAPPSAAFRTAPAPSPARAHDSKIP